MVEDKVVYLFSSSQRRVYKQDNINALCYPPGFIMHFRYDEKWVGTEIAQRDPDDFKDKEVIIVVVDIEEKNKKHFPRFYPIRKAKIKKVDVEGSVFHFYFELLPDWVDYRHNTDLRDYQSNIDSLKEKPISGEGGLSGKFVSFEELREDIKFSSKTKAWESIIEKIGNLSLYKETLFYRLSRFYEVNSNKDLKITKFDELRCGYTLEGGKKYNLELSFSYGKEPPDTTSRDKLIVKVDENFYMPIPNEIELGFRVDKQNIYLSTKELFFDTMTHLITTFKEGVIEGPNVTIPIKITYDRLRLGVSFSVLFIGLFLTSGLTSSITQIDQIPHDLLKLCGSLISTYVLFILYRKLK